MTCSSIRICPRSAGRSSGSTQSHSAPLSCAGTSSQWTSFWTLTCINWRRTQPWIRASCRPVRRTAATTTSDSHCPAPAAMLTNETSTGAGPAARKSTSSAVADPPAPSATSARSPADPVYSPGTGRQHPRTVAMKDRPRGGHEPPTKRPVRQTRQTGLGTQPAAARLTGNKATSSSSPVQRLPSRPNEALAFISTGWKLGDGLVGLKEDSHAGQPQWLRDVVCERVVPVASRTSVSAAAASVP